MSKHLRVAHEEELAEGTCQKRVGPLHPLLQSREVDRPYHEPVPSYLQGDRCARLPCPCLLRSVATSFVDDHRSESFAYVHSPILCERDYAWFD